MWRFGFLSHEIAFGLLSVFLPLYIVSIGGSLLDVGVMTSAALFLAIPASFFWGYSCDKTKSYKRYILISFLSSSILLFLLAYVNSVNLIILLYVVMAIFHVAHEPPKNVLIVELYSREEWEKSFAFYEGITEIGWLLGLILGTFVSLFGLAARTTLLMCSGLNFLAFILSLLLVEDPILVFERGLVNIEKNVDFTYKGILVASKVLEGFSVHKALKRENLAAFCCGLVLFSFATSTLFTPLPIFLSSNLGFSTSFVFTIYVLNSSAGAVGYFLASRKLGREEEKRRLQRIVFFRGLLVLLLAVFVMLGLQTAFLTASILALMGFAYALYHIYVLSLSMELIPAGKAGLFDVFVGLGGAAGAFIGPFFAQIFGFIPVFTIACIFFFSAYLAFRIFS